MEEPENNTTEELVLSPAAELAPGEIVIGLLQGLSSTGEPLVSFPQNVSTEAIPAMSTLAINAGHAGRQVALLFTQGDLNNPLIVGLIHSPLQSLIDGFEIAPAIDETEENLARESEASTDDANFDAYIDGKRVVLEGQEQVVLQCGEASITLTKAGKILIRGKYILNRSTGVNRILGGSVQVN